MGRFRVGSPMDVVVAFPRGSAPFWLSEQGFHPAGWTLRDSEVTWDTARKSVGRGDWISLGVNGLDRSAPAHYAVFLRASDEKNATPHGLDPNAWSLAVAAEGSSLETGVSRPVQSLPRELVGATLLRAAHDRRHAFLLARSRVWKTHVVASTKPDQISVGFGADARSELVWTWRTSSPTRGSLVRLRNANRRSGSIREIRGRSESIALPDLLNDPVVSRHTVRVQGLEAHTEYEYTVGDGTAEGTSAWAPVKTGPNPADNACLMYMGDPQCGLEGWGKLLAEAYQRRPDAGVLLIAGDLVDRGNERTNWDHFFLRAAGVFDRLPVMPAVGNHEYLDRGPWLYRKTFSLPPNGPRTIDDDLVYSFEYGDAFIAVLDSTLAVSDLAKARLQARWLDDRLERTQRTWKLVMFHHPIYASHPSRESPELLEAWVPVLERHKVDLVLQGHDHAYLRTYPLRGGRRADSPCEGTVYVVSVSGDKFYDQNPRGYTEVGFTRLSTYQTIDLFAREGRLEFRAFDRAGRQVDGFRIVKPTADRAGLASAPVR
jgi:hypothetical protein